MEILDRMLKRIDEKNKTAKELALYLGIDPSTISTWKARSTDPPIELTEVICEFLEMTYEFYITGKSSTLE